MLKFLYGMLAGYLLCAFEMTVWLIKKGYTSFTGVPDRKTIDKYSEDN